MNLRRFFTINLFPAVFFGICCSLFPVWAIRLYALALNEAAIWMTRAAGGSLLGFAIILT